MQQVDVEQTFGQMTRRTQGLLAVRAVVRVFIELLKNGEHPFAIVEEDLPLHNEHVAEAGFVAVEERLCVLLVVGIHAAQDLVATLQIIVMQQGSGFPQRAWSAVLIDDFFEIAEWRGDDVILLHHAGDVFVIQAILLCRGGIDVVVHDFAVGIFLMRSVREVEVTAVMAETVVVGVDVFPSPILRGQFAVTWVEIGDILAFIIVECPGEAIVLRSDLHRLHDGAVEGVNVFVSGDEDADVLFIVFVDSFRCFDSFVEIMHVDGCELLHLMETSDIRSFRILRQLAIVCDIEPCLQLGDAGSEVFFDDSVIGIIAHETVQFTSRDGRTEHSLHLLGGFRLFLFRNPDLPIIGKDFGCLALEALCAITKHVGMLCIGKFVGCIEIRLEMAAITGILRCIDHISATDPAAIVIHVSTTFLEGMVAIGECRNHEALVAVLRTA